MSRVLFIMQVYFTFVLVVAKMPPKQKLWVKPGYTTHMVSAYEKERLNNIANNKMRMTSLGVRHLTNSLRSVVEKNKQATSGKEKTTYVSEDDDEYRPFDDAEDDAHNECIDPQIEKVSYVRK